MNSVLHTIDPQQLPLGECRRYAPEITLADWVVMVRGYKNDTHTMLLLPKSDVP